VPWDVRKSGGHKPQWAVLVIASFGYGAEAPRQLQASNQDRHDANSRSRRPLKRNGAQMRNRADAAAFEAEARIADLRSRAMTPRILEAIRGLRGHHAP
jgi:hypothetical protein